MAKRRIVRLAVGLCLAWVLLSVTLSYARQYSSTPQFLPQQSVPSVDAATLAVYTQQHLAEAQQLTQRVASLQGTIIRSVSSNHPPRHGESLETFISTVLPDAAVQPRGYFTVNSTFDDEFSPDANPGDGACMDQSGSCGLRAAIMEANASSNLDHIILPAGTWTLALTGTGEDNALSGDLDITKPVIIQGAGAGLTIINAAFIDRVFDIYSAVDFYDLSIQNGTVADSGGALRAACGAEVLLRNTMLQGSNAGFGGALDVAGCGTPYSTHAYLYDSTLNNNNAISGGALDSINGGSILLSNVTISQNGASVGGAIFFTGANALQASSVTISYNLTGTADSAAVVAAGGGATITGSILAYNLSGQGDEQTMRNCDSAHPIDTGGYNVYTDETCPTAGTDLVDTTLAISQLALNVPGDTLTNALPGGSSALDRIPAGEQCPVKDQRGVPRPQFQQCDSGAYERDLVDPTATATPTQTSTETPTETATLEPTSTGTETATATDVPATQVTPTTTLTATPVGSETATPTGTVTETSTETPTEIITEAVSETPTETTTLAASETLTPTATATQLTGTELIVNGGFEGATVDPWVQKHATADKIKCDQPGKPVAYAGECAYRFKGGAGENSSLVQVVALEGLTFTANDVLNLTLHINGASTAINGKVKLRVVYGDQDQAGKLNLDITPTEGYLTIGNTLALDSGNITRIRLVLQNRSPKGKLLIDEVSLTKSTEGASVVAPLPGN